MGKYFVFGGIISGHIEDGIDCKGEEDSKILCNMQI